eukprot:TRINITY_DN34678_c0_g1_i1.p1 TRINITY_DN34678_c0_g1~~TRINITY_DN34678_c0_g1_i1.p1  ORF type:complete len:399 (-),score=51.67 TRINITY_DN34678_c0_g1_i1:41-1237(-)
MSDGVSLSVGMIFAGCMLNVITTEYVLKGDPLAGNLLTLTEIAMVLVQKVPKRLSTVHKYGFKPFVTPLTSHVQFTVLWSLMSVLANFAFAYKISIPIFTLIRSCNMIATVVLGWLCFKQRYTCIQLLCVVVVSVGIFLASLGEAMTLKKGVSSGSCTSCSQPSPPNSDAQLAGETEQEDELAIWLVGIGILAFVQLVQGLLGHIQSRFYKIYSNLASKDDLIDEFMFTSQIVALSPFLFMRNDIGAAAEGALNSDLVLGFCPSRIAWIILGSIAQSVCLRGVFKTSAVVSPLTLTIVLSVRKFLTVIFSVLWFDNPWSHWHSIATLLIFGGVFAYSQAPDPAAKSNKVEEETKTAKPASTSTGEPEKTASDASLREREHAAKSSRSRVASPGPVAKK